MPGMTLRLDRVDHNNLKLLTIVKRRSANQIIVDLLRDEFERSLPGRGKADHDPDAAIEGIQQAIGLPRLSERRQEEARAAEARLSEEMASAFLRDLRGMSKRRGWAGVESDRVEWPAEARLEGKGGEARGDLGIGFMEEFGDDGVDDAPSASEMVGNPHDAALCRPSGDLLGSEPIVGLADGGAAAQS